MNKSNNNNIKEEKTQLTNNVNRLVVKDLEHISELTEQDWEAFKSQKFNLYLKSEDSNIECVLFLFAFKGKALNQLRSLITFDFWLLTFDFSPKGLVSGGVLPLIALASGRIIVPAVGSFIAKEILKNEASEFVQNTEVDPLDRNLSKSY